MPTTITPATLALILTHMEAGEGEAVGWGQPARLYTFTDNPATGGITITEMLRWEWTVALPGLAPQGATGDVDHDLELYADRAQPLPGFLALVFMYESDADPDQDAPARRYLTAIDKDGTAYQVTRDRGHSPATEILPSPERNAFGTVLARIAAALRG
ncbi:hypothetical protein GCM10017673_38740 [Streptosporangium violaceochromogenes]|nr:hypothetical protein GCM10017673_38740 [Streptosporangium violaceochromogenes]